MAHALYHLIHTYRYCLVPLLAWFVSGTMKFLINSIRHQGLAFHLIGYGGLPSTHTAMVSAITTFIALESGIQTPVFGIAFTFMLIVIIDATGLRMQMGHHARALNRLVKRVKDTPYLRERIGHQSHEVIAGLLVGVSVGALAHLVG